MTEEGKARKVEIIVNGRERIVKDREVSFDEVVALVFSEPPQGEFIVITVAYRNAAGNGSGDLVKGQSVKVKQKGSIFDVTATDKS